MKETNKTFVFENINYLQLMLQSVDEKEFDNYLLHHQSSFQSVYSYAINLIHQLNDNKVLDEDYLKRICHFLDISEIDNVDILIDVINAKRVESEGIVPLTLTVLQNMVQCIRFMANDKSVDLNGIYRVSEMILPLRKLKQQA